MTKLHDLHSTAGQSPWMDFIRGDLLDNGELAGWVQQGLRGMTSNPTILEQAIAKSDIYKKQIQELSAAGNSPVQIYEQIATEDIRKACDILHTVYDAAGGHDGYVSLEVSPYLSHDRQGTVDEALRLREVVARPNLMIKVPATEEGLEAIAELTYLGVNVNVTLIFGQADYSKVMEAYLLGLEKRAAEGLPLNGIDSVASVFISRMDVTVNQLLQGRLQNQVSGKVAIANARFIYQLFADTFASARFRHLRSQGANVQRPLWASTGTKDPALKDVLYVDALVAPETVNTMPVQTLLAFLNHGTVERDAVRLKDEDQEILQLVASAGVNLDEVGLELKEIGLQQFAESFNNLIRTIEQVCSTVDLL